MLGLVQHTTRLGVRRSIACDGCMLHVCWHENGNGEETVPIRNRATPQACDSRRISSWISVRLCCFQIDRAHVTCHQHEIKLLAYGVDEHPTLACAFALAIVPDVDCPIAVTLEAAIEPNEVHQLSMCAALTTTRVYPSAAGQNVCKDPHNTDSMDDTRMRRRGDVGTGCQAVHCDEM